MLHALKALAALRHSEARPSLAAIRRGSEPLRPQPRQTKTQVPRRIPSPRRSHACSPDWKRRRLGAHLGRAPDRRRLHRADAQHDRAASPESQHSFHDDLALLGFRPAVVTICGARSSRSPRSMARAATPRDDLPWPAREHRLRLHDFPWPALCAEVAKLKIRNLPLGSGNWVSKTTGFARGLSTETRITCSVLQPSSALA